ncbi:MAG TPA: hypothetical protein VKH64_12880 [Candidatus Binatia bacterium]|nr:hypothetical protein [Candidatus Binatia bacterium]
MTEMIIVLGSLVVVLGWLRAIEGRVRIRLQDRRQNSPERKAR